MARGQAKRRTDGSRAGKTCRRGGKIVRASPRAWSQARATAFLDALGETANVALSAERAGVSTSAVYRRRQTDPAFHRAWAAALERGYGELEMMMIRQGLNGYERTETVHEVVDGARVVKSVRTIHDYPHAVLARLLVAHRGTAEERRAEMDIERPDSEAVVERVRLAMLEVRGRLLPAPGGNGPGGEDSDSQGRNGGRLDGEGTGVAAEGGDAEIGIEAGSAGDGPEDEDEAGGAA